jgi:hypothetical protein
MTGAGQAPRPAPHPWAPTRVELPGSVSTYLPSPARSTSCVWCARVGVPRAGHHGIGRRPDLSCPLNQIVQVVRPAGAGRWTGRARLGSDAVTLAATGAAPLPITSSQMSHLRQSLGRRPRSCSSGTGCLRDRGPAHERRRNVGCACRASAGWGRGDPARSRSTPCLPKSSLNSGSRATRAPRGVA